MHSDMQKNIRAILAADFNLPSGNKPLMDIPVQVASHLRYFGAIIQCTFVRDVFISI